MCKKRTVLVVEDDNKLRNTLGDYLSSNGFEVISACDGIEALNFFEKEKEKIDIVLLDGLLPELDGFDVLKKIRSKSEVPVIMLSARESEEAQLKGFKLGADNYLTKPFLLSVLKEHINRLLARVEGTQPNLLKRGALTIDTNLRKIMLDGETIETTPKEYDVLKYFAENENRVLDRELILDSVWGIDYYGDFRTVDTIVKQLRKKMTEKYPYIKSVYGVGYFFEV